MKPVVIEIHPKKAAFDPLARQVQSQLIELGEPAANASVSTCRLYRLEGDFNVEQLEKIAETILVDPVVETFTVQADAAKAKKGKVKEWVVDVWPKTGVTDPVGETVETALKDFGLKGPARASSGNRYQFPKIKDPKNLKILAKKFLANELIHDIDIRKPN